MKVFDTVKDITAILLLGLCGFVLWRYPFMILFAAICVMGIFLNPIINLIYKLVGKFRTNEDWNYNKLLKQSSFENYCDLMTKYQNTIEPSGTMILSYVGFFGIFVIMFVQILFGSIDIFSSDPKLRMMISYYIAAAIFLLEGCYIILKTTSPGFRDDNHQEMKANIANAVAKGVNANFEDDIANISCTVSQKGEHSVITQFDVCLMPENPESALNSIKVKIDTVQIKEYRSTRTYPLLTFIVALRDGSLSEAIQINKFLAEFAEKNEKIYELTAEPSCDGCGAIITLEKKSTFFVEKKSTEQDIECITELAVISYKMAE